MRKTLSIPVRSGIINDKKKGPTQGSWILASDIPADCLTKWEVGSPQHPHSIPGLAWCLESDRDGSVYAWRRLANAEQKEATVKDVTVDSTDPRWFF